MKQNIRPVSIFEQHECQLIEVKNNDQNKLFKESNNKWEKANMKDISFFNMVQKIGGELDKPQSEIKVTKDPHNQMLIKQFIEKLSNNIKEYKKYENIYKNKDKREQKRLQIAKSEAANLIQKKGKKEISFNQKDPKIQYLMRSPFLNQCLSQHDIQNLILKKQKYENQRNQNIQKSKDQQKNEEESPKKETVINKVKFINNYQSEYSSAQQQNIEKLQKRRTQTQQTIKQRNNYLQQGTIDENSMIKDAFYISKKMNLMDQNGFPDINISNHSDFTKFDGTVHTSMVKSANILLENQFLKNLVSIQQQRQNNQYQRTQNFTPQTINIQNSFMDRNNFDENSQDLKNKTILSKMNETDQNFQTFQKQEQKKDEKQIRKSMVINLTQRDQPYENLQIEQKPLLIKDKVIDKTSFKAVSLRLMNNLYKKTETNQINNWVNKKELKGVSREEEFYYSKLTQSLLSNQKPVEDDVNNTYNYNTFYTQHQQNRQIEQSNQKSKQPISVKSDEISIENQNKCNCLLKSDIMNYAFSSQYNSSIKSVSLMKKQNQIVKCHQIDKFRGKFSKRIEKLSNQTHSNLQKQNIQVRSQLSKKLEDEAAFPGQKKEQDWIIKQRQILQSLGIDQEGKRRYHTQMLKEQEQISKQKQQINDLDQLFKNE